MIVLVIALILLAGGVWYFASRPNTAGEATTQMEVSEVPGETTATSTPTPDTAPSGKTVTVTYNGTSFSPATVTISKGDTVRFVNSGTGSMWVASAVHPSHNVYDGTTRADHCGSSYAGIAPFDQCKAAKETYSFTFTKAGTWGYHDHVNAGATGKVVVQ